MSDTNTAEKPRAIAISQTHRERLGRIIQTVEPRPLVSSMMEWLIDQECERRGIDLTVNATDDHAS